LGTAATRASQFMVHTEVEALSARCRPGLSRLSKLLREATDEVSEHWAAAQQREWHAHELHHSLQMLDFEEASTVAEAADAGRSCDAAHVMLNRANMKASPLRKKVTGLEAETDALRQQLEAILKSAERRPTVAAAEQQEQWELQQKTSVLQAEACVFAEASESLRLRQARIGCDVGRVVSEHRDTLLCHQELAAQCADFLPRLHQLADRPLSSAQTRFSQPRSGEDVKLDELARLVSEDIEVSRQRNRHCCQQSVALAARARMLTVEALPRAEKVAAQAASALDAAKEELAVVEQARLAQDLRGEEASVRAVAERELLKEAHLLWQQRSSQSTAHVIAACDP